MRRSKPADNLPEHIAGLTWALSFHSDTSVHGSIVISIPCFQNSKPSFCFFMVEFLQSVSSFRASSNNNGEQVGDPTFQMPWEGQCQFQPCGKKAPFPFVKISHKEGQR